MVELLVVIAIIGVLIGLLIPAVQAARESSRRAQCNNNLKQIGLAISNYDSAYQRYPAGKKWTGEREKPETYAIAWSVLIMPFLESSNWEIDFQKPLYDPANLPVTETIAPFYLCPSTYQLEPSRGEDHRLLPLPGGLPGAGLACIDYLGISGPEKDAENPNTGEEYGRQRGVLIGTKGLPDDDNLVEPPPIRPKDVTDGLSQTACVTECTGRGVDLKKDEIDSLNGAWASGSNVGHIEKQPNSTKLPNAWYKERMHSDHPGGVNTLMADGSVHFFTESMDEVVVTSVCSRDGEELVDETQY